MNCTLKANRQFEFVHGELPANRIGIGASIAAWK
jgi:hypothetical protein